ncbi:MAG: Sec-independent protein translocase protein TatB [Rhodocyclaceae bacterium]|nr:Sec-independent protein translocase protein TatB [Rhodocyclaceae bacterium]MDP1957768.1 Sec-independent protein translocase protein TatB [Rhodocyclaceae bacterium]
MFDIGFTELMVIALVGLIVIGPERMPKVARTVGHLLGRLQRYVGDVKADIKREMQIEELKKLQSEMSAQVHDMESQVNEQMKATEASLNQSILPSADTTSATADSAIADTPAPAETAISPPTDRPPPAA